MLRAVIFDIDGVLVDSREANVDLYQKLLTKAGYPAPTREAILGRMHMPLWQSIEHLAGIEDQKEVERIWKMVDEPGVRDATLLEFPDTLLDTLEALHNKYRLAVVTSRVRAGTDEVLNTGRIGHLFDFAISFEDYKNPKPHPEPLLLALSRFGITADEAIYIGDSDSDIVAARAAGMRSIHLSRTPHPDATAVAKEFHELLSAVDSLA